MDFIGKVQIFLFLAYALNINFYIVYKMVLYHLNIGYFFMSSTLSHDSNYITNRGFLNMQNNF